MPAPNNLNDAIRNLQTYLREISFYDSSIPRVPIDGLYDSSTRAAVREFQLSRGLNVTGNVDKDTWDAIFGEYLTLKRENTRERQDSFFPDHAGGYVARAGEKSSFVAIVQLMLRELSADFDEIGELEIDGIFGKATEDAVSAFQRASLLEVTGEVDLETYNRLSRAFIGISRN